MNCQQTVANSYQDNEILDDFYFLPSDSKVQIIQDKPYITLKSKQFPCEKQKGNCENLYTKILTVIIFDEKMNSVVFYFYYSNLKL